MPVTLFDATAWLISVLVSKSMFVAKDSSSTSPYTGEEATAVPYALLLSFSIETYLFRNPTMFSPLCVPL